MRASGVLLIILIFGHLFVNLMVGDGIKADRLRLRRRQVRHPVLAGWDVLMLWLALIHGANGMRTIVNDYAHDRHAAEAADGRCASAAS